MRAQTVRASHDPIKTTLLTARTVTSAAAAASSTVELANFSVSDVLGGAQQAVAQQPTRGIKRSRTPEDSYADLQTGENGDGT
jgi:predicted phage tail protein